MVKSRTLIFVLVALLLGGCASQQPVNYELADASAMEQQIANRNLQECTARAQSAGLQPAADRGSQTAQKVARQSASGAANSAVMGVIRGAAGSGALIGALTGATSALVGAMFEESSEDSAYQNFIQTCMVEHGHDVTGDHGHDVAALN